MGWCVAVPLKVGWQSHPLSVVSRAMNREGKQFVSARVRYAIRVNGILASRSLRAMVSLWVYMLLDAFCDYDIIMRFEELVGGREAWMIRTWFEDENTLYMKVG